MTIAESVRNFLRTCPVLEDGRLNVDFLPEEAASRSMDVTPAAPVVKRYIDGSSLRQFFFALAARTLYGEEIRQQLDNLELLESFSDWLDQKNCAREFPDLGTGRRATRLEVTASGHVSAPGCSTARYQIQCRMLYEQAADYSTDEEN